MVLRSGFKCSGWRRGFAVGIVLFYITGLNGEAAQGERPVNTQEEGSRAPSESGAARQNDPNSHEVANNDGNLALDAVRERGLRIGKVMLRVSDVYPPDGDEPVPMPYSLVNALHRRTRRGIVRRELLFGEGDLFRPVLLEETERNLRKFRFLRFARVEAGEPKDGRVDVEVRTIDAWSTKFQVNAKSGGGKLTGSVGISEDNLLGLGKHLSAFYILDTERSRVQFTYLDPRLMGRFLSMTLSYSTGRDSKRRLFFVEKPFYSTLTSWSWAVWADARRATEFLYEAGEESLRFQQDELDVGAFVAVSLGSTPILVRRLRVGGRFQRDRFEEVPDANDPLPETFQERRFSRLLARFELREVRFIREFNINTYIRDEDFNLGGELLLEAGFAPKLLGSRDNTWFLLARAARGLFFGTGHFALAELRLSGRLGKNGVENGWGRLRLSHYFRLHRRITFATNVGVEVQKNSDPEEQLLLGGEGGLRGYKLRLFDGNKKILGRFEARFLLVGDLFKLVSLGAVAFTDAGNAWRQGDRLDPLSLHVDLGAGLRAAFPRSSQARVLRIDLSYALDDNGFDSPWLISFGSSQSF